jgi:hypothetical protein
MSHWSDCARYRDPAEACNCGKPSPKELDDYRLALQIRRECGDNTAEFKRRIDEISRARAA